MTIYGIIRICENSILDEENRVTCRIWPGGRFARLHHDLIHNGFGLTDFFTKRTAFGLSHGCCFGGGVKQVIIVLHK